MSMLPQKTLTVIIPIRVNSNVDIQQRLSWKNIPSHPELEVILVDDGSKDSDGLSELCNEKGWKYVYLNTKDAPFSLARARNCGIKNSSAKYIYFEDADFLHKSDFYEKIIELSSEIDNSPFNFASIPTIFLNQSSSEELLSAIGNTKKFDKTVDQYIARLPFINTDEENDLCDSFAPVGSNIIVRRDICFHVGLFDEYFNSWGGEDRDFVFKLLNHNSLLLRPIDFGITKKWKIHRTNAYEGWRAAYKLHGEWMARLGIYAVHIHHPDNGWKDPYAREANFSYAAKKAVDVASQKHKIQPEPIPGEDLSIFIGRNPTFFNDKVMQEVGSILVVEPDQRINPEEFSVHIIAHEPRRVFFQNPYGNQWLLSVWRTLKQEGIVCVCAERGALPWSIYFDEGGFCGDSPSYDFEHWKNSDAVDAKLYIDNLRKGAQALEPQGNVDISNLASKIDAEKKNVLVLLQSLTDATTNYFCGHLNSYNEFLSLVRDLENTNRYNLLVKDHPLNTKKILPAVGTPVDNYNIYDLYDKADVVLTLNSGAGLLALGDGVPAINAGASFYAQAGLAMQASTLEEVIDHIENPTISQEHVNRFFGYLINEFYSFATWTYSQRKYSDSTNMSLMSSIKYQKIRISGNSKEIKGKSLDRYSLIMDTYAFDLHQKKQNANSAVKASPSANVILAQAYENFHRKDYASAASKFDLVLEKGLIEAKVLRAAAEAYDRAGEPHTALERLMEASKLSGGHKPIMRRIKELKRPRPVRTFTRWTERPYPVG